MENNGSPSNERKSINKVRSFNSPPTARLVTEPNKRKSFYANGAIKSLDLALGRLKKSKLVNGECRSMVMGNQGTSEMCMDVGNINSSQEFIQGIDDASLMSMNFSQYELMRNLSRSNCNSDGGFSGNTCSVVNADINLKDEHLERYFRSIEMWTRNYRDGGSSTIPLEIPEK